MRSGHDRAEDTQPHPQVVLDELALQLRSGSVYDRDLRSIGTALVEVNNALEQRLTGRRG